jgi:regulator of Ty1 transposition protein 103
VKTVKMAFTEDSLKAKLSSLNETQDAISTVGQWILFHRRHADRIAQVWLQRLRESPPPKKLVLIYLANGMTNDLSTLQELAYGIHRDYADVKDAQEGGIPTSIRTHPRRSHHRSLQRVTA